MPRFYYPAPLAASGKRLLLPDALAHHAVRVLRLRDGTAIVLFDGSGGQYPAVLRIEGRQAWAELGDFDAREAELPGRITLVQGLPGSDKMDWVVEKAVELGAAALAPIQARRSVVQLSAERAGKRLAHWRRIAQASAEQCGRNRLMDIAAPRSLEDYLAQPAAGLRLLCHPEADATLAQALAPLAGQAQVELSLLVGPEGGWSEEELQAARRAGVQAVRFGPRVLRTETAGLALIAAASALLGW